MPLPLAAKPNSHCFTIIAPIWLSPCSQALLSLSLLFFIYLICIQLALPLEIILSDLDDLATMSGVKRHGYSKWNIALGY